MAEVVHRNLEAMLPQLEALESTGVFSHDEIKIIVRRRRNHEYKLVRRPARKEDYLAAIQYEVHLDMLRKHRKKKLGIATTKRDADNGIQNRIHGLFRRALRKFKGNLKMWLQYIEFAKRCGHKITLTKLYGRALAIHPNKPGLWVMAAKFEFEEMKDVSAARALIQQGLRANSDSKHLWLEHFRLELMHAEKVRKSRTMLGLERGDVEAPVSDDFLAYKTASIVFEHAIKNIPDDVEFHVSFLPIVRLFEDTADLQCVIYDSLKTSHASHPLTWDSLARREWTDVDTSLLDDDQIIELEEQSEEIFTEGLAQLAAEGQKVTGGREEEMWSVYVIWCEERYLDSNNSEALKKRSLTRLLETCDQSLKRNALSETLSRRYIDLLLTNGQTDEARVTSSLATDAHPSSVQLWLVRLDLLASANESQTNSGRTRRSKVMKKKGEAKVCEVCREALEKVADEDSLPVWLFWLEHMRKNEFEEKEIESLFQTGLTCRAAPVVETLSNWYLEWAVQIGGIKRARTVYRRLLERGPTPLSLFTKCIEMEKMSATADDSSVIVRLREMFESALREYGSSKPGLWLDYIKTELSCPGGEPGRVGKLHWRAVKELNDKLTADFITKYSLVRLH